MDMNRPSNFSIRKSFLDFDDLAETVHDWQLEFIQLERGAFRGSIDQAVGEHFQLGRASFGRRLHQRGETPAGFRTFVVPGDVGFRILWRGKEICSDDIAVFPEGAVLDSTSLPGFHVLLPSLPQALLDERAHQLDLPPVDRIVGNAEVVRCDPRAVDRLRRWLRSVIDELVERPELLGDATTSEEISRAMAGNLITTLATGSGAPVRSALTPRLQLSEASLDFIAGYPGRLITVREVAEAVGASERTLRRAFHERFGVSPKEYLKARQLRAARRDLVRLDPAGIQVREVALRWGFWHSSQFAQDYRRAFGELPSETLRRSAGRER